MTILKKLLLLSLFLALIFTYAIKADDDSSEKETETEDVLIRSGDDSDYLSVSKNELEKLKSLIVNLESRVDEITQQLRCKGEIINQKKKLMQEKLEHISYLQSDIASLREKGSVDAKEQVRQAHEQADELEKMVVKLKTDIELQQKEKSTLEVRVSDVEKIIQKSKSLEDLVKINVEQEIQFRKTERALHVAEEEMIKDKFEATSKSNDPVEVHGSWLPPWLAARLIRLQSLVEMHWADHGKPAMEIAMMKTLEKKAQAEKWAEPHLESVKTVWIPAIKEQYVVITTYAEPHVHLPTTKSVEVYEAAKNAINPHIIRAPEFAEPRFQEVKKFSKPYIDQVATVTKPHFEKVRDVLNPYANKAIHAYGKFLECATTYHHQVQETVQDVLKRHEFTTPFAMKEFGVAALEKKALAEKWAEPHLESVKTAWIPAIKEQYVVITTYAEPHVHLLTTKSVEVYEASKNAIKPHIIKAREFAEPRFQEVKKFSKPYIDQVATVTKPQFEKVRVVLNPYANKAIHAYGKFIQCATTYHHQVQETVQEVLKRHEFTTPFAMKEFVRFATLEKKAQAEKLAEPHLESVNTVQETVQEVLKRQEFTTPFAMKEFVRFAATALLALPIITLFRVCSSVFCIKMAKKPVGNAHTDHARRKGQG